MFNLEKLISYIKGENSYKIDSNYSSYEILISLYARGIQVVRGSIYRMLGLKVSGLFFRGNSVKIKYWKKFKSGRNLILGDFCYINALSEHGMSFGENVTIERNGLIIGTGVISRKGVGLKIGNNTGINSIVYLGCQGGISIGNNVIIGPGVQIHSENHLFNGEELIKNQGEIRKQVIIEDDCWIGAGAIILAGVHLKSKTVVAAGSVVTKSFDSNKLIGGIPAQIIKSI